MRSHFCFLVAWITVCAVAYADAFRNLDFEEATLNLTQPFPSGGVNEGVGTIRDLLPGWTAYLGNSFINSSLEIPAGRLVFDMFYNQRSSGFGESFLTLSKGQVTFSLNLPGFSVLVAPHNTFIGADSYWLQQRGDIPADARTLLADGMGFKLWVDGVKADQDGSLSVFDISPYAGRSVELGFEFYPRAPFPIPAPPPVYSGIDNIRFSPETIPEPGTFALLGLGACLFIALRQRGK